MRIRMIGLLGALALGLSGCGGTSTKVLSEVRPPLPINLGVYVSDSSVSVSPSSIGAGPVVFTVTNQSSHAESLTISRSGQSRPIASTAPINPLGATQVSVDFTPGQYTVATGAHDSTDAALAGASPIRAASIHVGAERANSSGALLQP
jgi:hypothetical protein